MENESIGTGGKESSEGKGKEPITPFTPFCFIPPELIHTMQRWKELGHCGHWSETYLRKLRWLRAQFDCLNLLPYSLRSVEYRMSENEFNLAKFAMYDLGLTVRSVAKELRRSERTIQHVRGGTSWRTRNYTPPDHTFDNVLRFNYVPPSPFGHSGYLTSPDGTFTVIEHSPTKDIATKQLSELLQPWQPFEVLTSEEMLARVHGQK